MMHNEAFFRRFYLLNSYNNSNKIFLIILFLLFCYQSLHCIPITRSRQVSTKKNEKNEKNQLKHFSLLRYILLEINYFIIKLKRIRSKKCEHCCLNSSLLSIWSIHNVFGSVNNFNFQFSNIDAAYNRTKEILQGFLLHPKKRIILIHGFFYLCSFS